MSAPLRQRARGGAGPHRPAFRRRALARCSSPSSGCPPPTASSGIAGGSNTSQTARMLAALEPVIDEVGPDAVLVYGDTNSTLAGALAGAQAGVPVAHVEAGMRSFDRSMPEELNRVLVDHASALLLCSSRGRGRQPRREHVSGAVELVGDVMVDVAIDDPAARARPRSTCCARAGVEPRRLRARHRAPGGQRRRSRRGWRARRSAARRSRSRWCSRSIRARARGCATPGSTSASSDDRAHDRSRRRSATSS